MNVCFLLCGSNTLRAFPWLYSVLPAKSNIVRRQCNPHFFSVTGRMFVLWLCLHRHVVHRSLRINDNSVLLSQPMQPARINRSCLFILKPQKKWCRQLTTSVDAPLKALCLPEWTFLMKTHGVRFRRRWQLNQSYWDIGNSQFQMFEHG